MIKSARKLYFEQIECSNVNVRVESLAVNRLIDNKYILNEFQYNIYQFIITICSR